MQLFMDSPYQLNAPFLAELFVDEGLLYWNPPCTATDLARRVIDVFRVFQEEPRAVTALMVRGIVDEPNAQVQNPDSFMLHSVNAGKIYRALVERLLETEPELDLPPPAEAYARGLLHDISAAYSDYKKTGQASKEIDLYFHARHLGVGVLAHNIAMHGAYLEILDLIFSGAAFPFSGAYGGMRTALHHDGLYEQIRGEFALFREGVNNLPLMALTLSDYLAVQQECEPTEILADIERFYVDRTADLVHRYYESPLAKNQPASAFGRALVSYGGLERADFYRRRVQFLLEKSEPERAGMRRGAPMLWRSGDTPQNG